MVRSGTRPAWVLLSSVLVRCLKIRRVRYTFESSFIGESQVENLARICSRSGKQVR